MVLRNGNDSDIFILNTSEKVDFLRKSNYFFPTFETLGKFGGSFKGEILYSQQGHFQLPSL